MFASRIFEGDLGRFGLSLQPVIARTTYARILLSGEIVICADRFSFLHVFACLFCAAVRLSLRLSCLASFFSFLFLLVTKHSTHRMLDVAAHVHLFVSAKLAGSKVPHPS